LTTAWEYLRAKELRVENKVAVCIPHIGTVPMEWAIKFKELLLPEGSNIFLMRGAPIDVARNQLVEIALEQGFSWIFFMDADVVLNRNAVLTLLSHRLPIVSGIYRAKKREGFYWCAYVESEVEIDGKKVRKFLPVESFNGRLVRVDMVGMGATLIHADVFKFIRKRTDLPFFLWTKDRSEKELDKLGVPTELRNLSEDFYFCRLAKLVGNFDIYVDTQVVGHHIGTLKLKEDGISVCDI